MKIIPRTSGKTEFLSLYRKTMDENIIHAHQDPARLHYLRCSQLPYCPRSVLLNYTTRGLIQPMGAMFDYYVSVGTAVHSVMQRHLPMTGQLLADYRCKECGKRYPMSHQFECCGFPTEYEEITISYKGVKGHIDCVFRDSKGRYWIIDFKTTGLQSAPGKLRNPGQGYVRQVRAYAWLLRAQHKITVAGIMLFFIPRDDPKKPVVWDHLMKDTDWDSIKEELKVDKRLHKDTMVAKTSSEIKELLKTKCGSQYCEACKMPASRILKEIMAKARRLPIKTPA